MVHFTVTCGCRELGTLNRPSATLEKEQLHSVSWKHLEKLHALFFAPLPLLYIFSCTPCVLFMCRLIGAEYDIKVLTSPRVLWDYSSCICPAAQPPPPPTHSAHHNSWCGPNAVNRPLYGVQAVFTLQYDEAWTTFPVCVPLSCCADNLT